MAITEVNLRDFRKDLSSMLDQVDAGVSIVLSRGGNKRYTIIPVEDGDLDFTPEMYEQIERAMEEVRRGETIRLSGTNEIDKYITKKIKQ